MSVSRAELVHPPSTAPGTSKGAAAWLSSATPRGGRARPSGARCGAQEPARQVNATAGMSAAALSAPAVVRSVTPPV